MWLCAAHFSHSRLRCAHSLSLLSSLSSSHGRSNNNNENKLKVSIRAVHGHNVNLITVPIAKTLGEWAGLCKIDSEGNARKVVGASCVVVKDFGEESEGLHIVQEYAQSH